MPYRRPPGDNYQYVDGGWTYYFPVPDGAVKHSRAFNLHSVNLKNSYQYPVSIFEPINYGFSER